MRPDIALHLIYKLIVCDAARGTCQQGCVHFITAAAAAIRIYLLALYCMYVYTT